MKNTFYKSTTTATQWQKVLQQIKCINKKVSHKCCVFAKDYECKIQYIKYYSAMYIPQSYLIHNHIQARTHNVILSIVCSSFRAME